MLHNKRQFKNFCEKFDNQVDIKFLKVLLRVLGIFVSTIRSLGHQSNKMTSKQHKKGYFGMLLDKLGANILGNLLFTHGNGAIVGLTDGYFVIF